MKVASAERGSPAAALLGQRVRAARRRAGLTLAELGARVGRPAPYLSKLENGRIEAKLSLLQALAETLGTDLAELVRSEAPTRRVDLELRHARLQEHASYRRLAPAPLRPTSRLPDVALEHLVALGDAVVGRDAAPGPLSNDAHSANLRLRAEMRARQNYFAEVEDVAAARLVAAGYEGRGPVTERVVLDLVASAGFTVERVAGVPHSARSVTDLRSRTIYIPQRTDLRTRPARSVILQTLGHFVLDHSRTENFADYLRQRIESNYFAAAVLAPEEPAVELLQRAKALNDISVVDLKEAFYLSYEMAAHRFTNLATRHLAIPTHFLRTDADGVILKAYENDGIPLPVGPDGRLEGERVNRRWGAQQAWYLSDDASLHYQYTLTDDGEYWSVTNVETTPPAHAITVGTSLAHASVFRGSATMRKVRARQHDFGVEHDLAARWDGVAWPSTAERSYVLSALPPSQRPFTPYPGVDLVDVFHFLDRQTAARRRGR